MLGFEVGDTENEVFWTGFLRPLNTRGFSGVALVMSDAHTGLKKAIDTVFLGASWQRCRVHFMRNVLSVVRKGSQDMIASVFRTVLARPDAHHDLLAFAAFPKRHWRQIWSTNPLERVDGEIKRRTDEVGIFPNPAALLRLAGSVLIEQHDEWEACDRRYFSSASMLELKAMNVTSETI